MQHSATRASTAVTVAGDLQKLPHSMAVRGKATAPAPTFPCSRHSLCSSSRTSSWPLTCTHSYVTHGRWRLLTFLLTLRFGPGWLSQYGDSLRDRRSGERIPVGGDIFRTYPDRPWANGYRVPFPEVRWSERGVYQPPPSSAEVKERVELYLYYPSEPPWPVRGETLPEVKITHFRQATFAKLPAITEYACTCEYTVDLVCKMDPYNCVR